MLNRIKVLTKKGLEENGKWQGLKNYLKNLASQNEKPSMELLEKYLSRIRK